MIDWVVWPIFCIQLVAFLLLFLPRRFKILGIKVRVFVLMLLFLVCIAITVSLYQDATDKLNLYF